uniref:Uncharacterized protein n=1 Tax=Glossina austeni TaxID=7395 RepID=A0A1A9UKU8_GLOAU
MGTTCPGSTEEIRLLNGPSIRNSCCPTTKIMVETAGELRRGRQTSFEFEIPTANEERRNASKAVPDFRDKSDYKRGKELLRLSRRGDACPDAAKTGRSAAEQYLNESLKVTSVVRHKLLIKKLREHETKLFLFYLKRVQAIKEFHKGRNIILM